jgi:hypothetical protein
MITDNNYNKIDTFHGQVVAYLPMVFSTSKPKPLLDFPALCISASFLPRTDWQARNYYYGAQDFVIRSTFYETHLIASRSTKFDEFHNDERTTCR